LLQKRIKMSAFSLLAANCDSFTLILPLFAMTVRTILPILALLAGVVWVNAWADGAPKPGEVLGSVEYFKETATSNQLHIEQVLALPDSSFRTQDPCCNIGLSKRAVWFRFREQNDKHAGTDFLVEVVNPSIESLHFYTIRGQKTVQSFVTGAAYTFGQRPDTSFRHATTRNFTFPVSIPKDSVVWCYLRVQSEYPVSLRILFFEKEDRVQHQQRNVDILMTIFYAFCVLFLVLAAILIVSIQQPFHWYYFGYVLLTTLFVPVHLGLGFRYLWPDFPEFQFVVPMALNNLRLIFGIQFFRYYVDLAKTAPTFNRLVNWMLAVFSITLVVQLLHRAVDPWFFVGWVFYPFFGLLLLFCVLVLFWLLRQIFLRRSKRLTWIYVIVALNFLGVAITSQQYTGITWLQQFGMGWIDLDVADKVLTVCGIANTFFLSPLVIVAFFLEMVLVFNISNKRYLQLIEKGQKAQLRLAKAREATLKALIMGAENERRRIARDLHDGACVNLAAINMKMDALAEHLEKQPEMAQKIAEIAEDIGATYKEVRDISHDLMSKSLEKTGLRAAVEELAMRTERTQQNLHVNLFINFPLDMVGNTAKIHLYRMIQELLGNILKHAKASDVTLQLLKNERNLLLTVEDNGIGFAPENTDADGIGLSNIKSRVETLHGTFLLESAPGKGVFISIEIPEQELEMTGA
jgi:signal transduction histidine kinase